MLDHHDYKELFHMQGELTCLHSELFVKGSLKLGDPLILYKQGNWYSFLKKEKEIDCLRAGLRIFSDKTRYEEYAKSFRDYIQNAKEQVISKFKSVPTSVDKEEFKQFLQELGTLWQLYGLTEFPYTDLAFQRYQETNDEQLKKNLDDVSKLKIEGREILNAFIFSDGVTPNVLRYISKRFLTHETDAFYLYSDEILALYDGKYIDEQIINERKNYYGILSSGETITILSRKEVQDVFDSFTSYTSTDMLKGRTANKGKARGTVVIAPMLIEREEVKKVVERMKKGNILVAQSTTPEFLPLCKLAAAIVTDQGGLLSHAAVVSRELNIPCIIGTIHGTKVFKDGDLVEVDADKGTIKKIS